MIKGLDIFSISSYFDPYMHGSLPKKKKEVTNKKDIPEPPPQDHDDDDPEVESLIQALTTITPTL